jgi:hypothetical protein
MEDSYSFRIDQYLRIGKLGWMIFKMTALIFSFLISYSTLAQPASFDMSPPVAQDHYKVAQVPAQRTRSWPLLLLGASSGFVLGLFIYRMKR